MTRIEQGAAATAALLGLLALLGWLLDLPVLASFVASRIPMAPSSASFFLLFGLALTLRGAGFSLVETRGDGRGSLLLERLTRGLVLGLSLASAALLVGSLFGLRPAIERFGLALSRDYPGFVVGTMSPATALLFCLVGAAFLVESRKAARRRDLATLYLASGILALAFIFLLGYLLGEPLLYGSALVPPALSTICAFLALGVSLLTRALGRLHLFNGRRKRDEHLGVAILPILLLFLVGILATSYLYYRIQESKYRSAVETQLQSVLDLKIAQLRQYRLDRLEAAAFLATLDDFNALARRCLAAPGDASAEAELLGWFARLEARAPYKQVSLHDARGETRLAFPAIGTADAHFVLPPHARAPREPEFLDFFLSPEDGKAYLGVLVPILDSASGGAPLGTVVLRIDPTVFLYPFIETWPSASDSAETLLLRREGDLVLYLNRLRFSEEAPLTIRISLARTEVPAVRAVLGEVGLVEGLDYRGVPVIAAVAPVPDSPWFVVARMDRREAFELLRETMWVVVAVVSGLAVGATGFVYLFFQQHLRRERRLRIESAARLRETSHILDSIFEFANAPILVWDAELRIRKVNQAFERLSERSSAELLGQPLVRLFPPDLAASYLERIRGIRPGERWEAEELRILSSGGEIRTLLWNTTPLSTDGASLIRSTIAQGQDITAVRDAEGHLQRQIEELKRWQNVMLEREARIEELKAEVNSALAEGGAAPRYAPRTPPAWSPASRAAFQERGRPGETEAGTDAGMEGGTGGAGA